VFRRRTDVMLAGTLLGIAVLAAIGFVPRLWMAVALLVAWGLVFAAVMPMRQAYLNSLIDSEVRATVLSFDSLMGSAGAVGAQPVLGRIADAWGYPLSYACSSAIQALAIPFLLLSRRERAPSDAIPRDPPRRPRR
jgi:MFS family permease